MGLIAAKKNNVSSVVRGCSGQLLGSEMVLLVCNHEYLVDVGGVGWYE